MDYSHRYRVEYSENVAPKYPAGDSQEGLEVVPNDSPLYPSPAHAVPHATGDEKWPGTSRAWGDTSSPITPAEDHKEGERRRILGLTIPIFWLVIVIVVIILAAGIGGGIGGGLAQQQKLNSDTTSAPQESAAAAGASSSGDTPSPTSSQVAAATVAANGPLPSDGGCPLIEGQRYTPYSVDGKAIPLEKGQEGQQFRQQCYTNYVASTAARTHNILRIFMPTLENCMMACAEYNSAYRGGLNGDAGVGGGYCVAVTLEKVESGFCYLKNGTSTNDTQGQPEIYSSAVLLTDLGT
ncbi:hypothetical protein AAE478_008710 [Parahypoxylon ruwenzoriense]